MVVVVGEGSGVHENDQPRTKNECPVAASVYTADAVARVVATVDAKEVDGL